MGGPGSAFWGNLAKKLLDALRFFPSKPISIWSSDLNIDFIGGIIYLTDDLRPRERERKLQPISRRIAQ